MGIFHIWCIIIIVVFAVRKKQLEIRSSFLFQTENLQFQLANIVDGKEPADDRTYDDEHIEINPEYEKKSIDTSFNLCKIFTVFFKVFSGHLWLVSSVSINVEIQFRIIMISIFKSYETNTRKTWICSSVHIIRLWKIGNCTGTQPIQTEICRWLWQIRVNYKIYNIIEMREVVNFFEHFLQKWNRNDAKVIWNDIFHWKW